VLSRVVDGGGGPGARLLMADINSRPPKKEVIKEVEKSRWELDI
jgi:hypothetical protein